MRPHDVTKSDEADEAAWEAGKGGLVGATKWGAAAAVLGAIGYAWSPLYRAMTIQFKVRLIMLVGHFARRSLADLSIFPFSRRYLQMSGMVLGGMVEADWQLRQYENQIRVQRRWLKEQAQWERFKDDVSSKNDK